MMGMNMGGGMGGQQPGMAQPGMMGQQPANNMNMFAQMNMGN